MARSQVEILIESVANLHLQLSASLARESELRDTNDILARKLNDFMAVSESELNSNNNNWVPNIPKFIGSVENQALSYTTGNGAKK